MLFLLCTLISESIQFPHCAHHFIYEIVEFSGKICRVFCGIVLKGVLQTMLNMDGRVCGTTICLLRFLTANVESLRNLSQL